MPTRPWHIANAEINAYKDTVLGILLELTDAQSYHNRLGIVGAISQIGTNSVDALAFLNGIPLPLEWIPSQQWGTNIVA